MSGDGVAAQIASDANNPPQGVGVLVEGQVQQTSRPWSREEDQMIIDHVTANGTKSWSQLAGAIPGRTGKQMRERWHNQLDPNIKKDPWTPEEDQRLLQLYQDFGSRWAEISKRFPGRTDNSIKNRWYGNVRKGSRTLEKQTDGTYGDGGALHTSGVKEAGSKRSSEGGSGPSKRQATGAHGQGATSVLFSNLGEAMSACSKVLADLVVNQIQRAVAVVLAGSESSVDTAQLPSELNAIKDKIDSGALKSPFDVHEEVVAVFRRSLDTDGQSPLYSIHVVLSQIFDEQFFKHVYVPLGNSVKLDRTVAQGLRARVYDAPERVWLVSHDANGAQDVLQVWVAIPSFYAHLEGQQGLLHFTSSFLNGGVQAPPNAPVLVGGSQSAGSNRRGYKAREGGGGGGAGGVEHFSAEQMKEHLSNVHLSALFPSYTGTETALSALEIFVERSTDWPSGSV